ncbi:DUF7344 domain-containing protein [Haloarchaeobius baliensis]|uniref:DUF7344 domain-containing protein n=1 Tax=Haloarchaeobius baliensis TaxID=1670458 RepID=UPI003F884495
MTGSIGPRSTDDSRGPTRRRQFIISYLDDVETPVTLDELTDAVVAWEHEEGTAGPTERDRRTVREELYEVDLPGLADDGLITYNREEGLLGSYRGDASSPDSVDSDSDPEPPVMSAQRTTGRSLQERHAGAGMTLLTMASLVVAAPQLSNGNSSASILVGAVLVAAIVAHGAAR